MYEFKTKSIKVYITIKDKIRCIQNSNSIINLHSMILLLTTTTTTTFTTYYSNTHDYKYYYSNLYYNNYHYFSYLVNIIFAPPNLPASNRPLTEE